MICGNRVLAVVPARAGSKGVPGKNIRTVGGRSMIARAASTLAALDWIDRRVISTDSAEHADIGRAAGLEVPFMRPAHLARDDAGAVETIEHALLACESGSGVRYDIIVIVEPSSPLRRPSDIEACVRLLLEGGFDATLTVSRLDPKFHPRKILSVEGDRVAPYLPGVAPVVNRQELGSGLVFRNGCAYALTRRCLCELRKIVPENAGCVITQRHVVNVDSELEVEIADLVERGGFGDEPTRGGEG